LNLQAAKESQKTLLLLDLLGKAAEALDGVNRLRDGEPSLRWRANYDLTRAELIGFRARLFEYGAALDAFRKSPPEDDTGRKLTSWKIETATELRAADKTQDDVDRATQRLRQVADDHRGTPWAARAEWELGRGFGVKLTPVYERDRAATPGVPVPKP